MTALPPPSTAGAIRSSPLWTVLLLTWVCSLGTGMGWNGVFFIAKSTLNYDEHDNLWLALLLGVAYTASAWVSAPIHAMVTRSRRVSTRGMLIVVSAGSALACFVPFLLPSAANGEPSALGFWVFSGSYLCLAGLLWPFVESFVSGGRQGAPLRRATALFNVTWASAVMAAMWVLSPLLQDHGWEAIAGLGVLHLVTIPLVLMLAREPLPHGSAAHRHDDTERALYIRLRRSFRRLLVTSYLLLAAVGPVLPSLMERLEVELTHQTLLASVWMTLRFGAFVVLWKWGGWHGRLTLAAWTGVLLGIGFGMTFFAPAVPILVIGLALLGVGAGTAYFGALYYAMELDSAQVDAGGKHEAMIGAGYAAGPVLAAILLWVMGNGAPA